MGAVGSTSVSRITPDSTTPTIYNVNVLLANTEYSQALPSNTKRFLIKAREAVTIKLAYVSGESGTKYLTLSPRAVYEVAEYFTAVTLYFQCSNTSIVEIVAYST